MGRNKILRGLRNVFMKPGLAPKGEAMLTTPPETIRKGRVGVLVAGIGAAVASYFGVEVPPAVVELLSGLF